MRISASPSISSPNFYLVSPPVYLDKEEQQNKQAKDEQHQLAHVAVSANCEQFLKLLRCARQAQAGPVHVRVQVVDVSVAGVNAVLDLLGKPVD